MSEYKCCDECYGYMASQKPHGMKAVALWTSLCNLVAEHRVRAMHVALSAKEVMALDQLFMLQKPEDDSRSILIPMLERLGYILTTDIPGGMAIKVLGRDYDKRSKAIVYCPRGQKCVRVLNEIL